MNFIKMVFARFLSEYPIVTSAIEARPKLGTTAGSVCRATPWFLAAAAVFSAGPADATNISVNDVFLALEQASVNDIQASTAPVLFIGADHVVPNGTPTGGTTGVAASFDGSITNHLLLNQSSTAFPNQISTGIGGDAIPYDGSNPNLLKPWTLTFTNSGFQTPGIPTPPIAGPSIPVGAVRPADILPPFANTVTVNTATGIATPTISWAGTGNGAFVQILDKNQCGGGASGSQASCRGMGLSWPNVVYSPGDLPASGSKVIPSGVLNNPSDSFVIVVSEVYTHDGSTNTMHDNEAAISRALFDYTPSSGVPPVPINIPMIDSSGVFHFNFGVTDVGTPTYYIDPQVATGYIYEIGAGNPNFASVELPILEIQAHTICIYGMGVRSCSTRRSEPVRFLTSPPAASANSRSLGSIQD